MDCESAEKLFARMIFGELEGEQGTELSEHLAGCEACSETLAGMRRAAYLVREGLGAQAPVLSPERREAVLGETKKPQRTAPGKMKKPRQMHREHIRLAPKTDYLPLFTGVGAAAAGIIFIIIMAGMFMPDLFRSREEAVEYEVNLVARHEPAGGAKHSAYSKRDMKKEKGTVESLLDAIGLGDQTEESAEYEVAEVEPRDRSLSLGVRRQVKTPPPSAAKPTARPPSGWDDGKFARKSKPSGKGGGVAVASADTGTEWEEVGVKARRVPSSSGRTAVRTQQLARADDGMELSETAKGFEDAASIGVVGGPGGKRRAAIRGGDDKSGFERSLKGPVRKEEVDRDHLAMTPAKAPSPARGISKLMAHAVDEKDKLTKSEIVPREELEKAKEKAVDGPVFKAVPVNPFVMTKKNKLSTFAINVSVTSYTRTRSYIRKGYLPPAASVRMEEFINAFDYNYPRQTDKTFAVHAKAAPSVFGRALTLIKIGIKGRVLGRDGRKPAHFVFVVDASESMARQDRMPLIQYGLTALVGKLKPRDRISLVIYSTKARLILEAVPAEKKKQIAAAVRSIQCGGYANMAEGLALGYSMAGRHFRAGEINRVILCSGGVANIGATDTEQMLKRVETFRNYGITFSSISFGMGVYNDALLEKLANRGNGTYSFCDSREEARRIFVEKMSAEIQTIAKDARIRVEFNVRRIRRYRLLGYENRDIRDGRFRGDTVDAGEVGSGQSATALYEVELLKSKFKGGAPEHLGKVYVRYRNADTGKIEEISHRLENDIIRRRSPEKEPRYFLAACAAEFAEILRMSEHAKNGNLADVQRLLERVTGKLPLDQKVRELLWLVKRAQGLPRAG